MWRNQRAQQGPVRAAVELRVAAAKPALSDLGLVVGVGEPRKVSATARLAARRRARNIDQRPRLSGGEVLGERAGKVGSQISGDVGGEIVSAHLSGEEVSDVAAGAIARAERCGGLLFCHGWLPFSWSFMRSMR